jgi:hypothetical protein
MDSVLLNTSAQHVWNIYAGVCFGLVALMIIFIVISMRKRGNADAFIIGIIIFAACLMFALIGAVWSTEHNHSNADAVSSAYGVTIVDSAGNQEALTDLRSANVASFTVDVVRNDNGESETLRMTISNDRRLRVFRNTDEKSHGDWKLVKPTRVAGLTVGSGDSD